eukprot:6190709-Pleurochrysis_carterae.AAC.1
MDIRRETRYSHRTVSNLDAPCVLSYTPRNSSTCPFWQVKWVVLWMCWNFCTIRRQFVRTAELVDVNNCVLLVEKQLGRTLGDETSPLLLSVRSGAAISMCELLCPQFFNLYYLIDLSCHRLCSL